MIYYDNLKLARTGAPGTLCCECCRNYSSNTLMYMLFSGPHLQGWLCMDCSIKSFGRARVQADYNSNPKLKPI